jgi:hypothetical protein
MRSPAIRCMHRIGPAPVRPGPARGSALGACAEGLTQVFSAHHCGVPTSAKSGCELKQSLSETLHAVGNGEDMGSRCA